MPSNCHQVAAIWKDTIHKPPLDEKGPYRTTEEGNPMQQVSIDPASYATDVYRNEFVQVKPTMFGAIATGMLPGYADQYQYFVEKASINLIRWPGGTFSEVGLVTGRGNLTLVNKNASELGYSLDYPELIHPTALASGQGIAGLSDMLNLAIINKATFSLILPTKRFLTDLDAAYESVTTFLRYLLVDAIYNDGAMPKDLILEIGNEFYSPQEYALVSAHVLKAISDFRSQNPDEEDFKVALQTMQSGPSTIAMVNAFQEAERSLGVQNLLAEVDVVRIHSLNHGLPSISEIEDRSQVYWAVKRLTDAVDSAISSKGLAPRETELYFSAFTVTSNDVLDGLPAGLPAASALLSIFTGMIELGADYAAAWGIAAGSAAPTSLSFVQDGKQIITPMGLVYSMMAESIAGKYLLATPNLDAKRDDLFNLYAFSAQNRTVVFIAANDIPDDGSLVSLDLGPSARIGRIEMQSVTADGGMSGAGILLSKDFNLSEEFVSFRLVSDYEVVRIVIDHFPMRPSNLHIEENVDENSMPDATQVTPPISETFESVGTKPVRLLDLRTEVGVHEVDLKSGSVKVDGRLTDTVSAKGVHLNDYGGRISGDAGDNRILGGNGQDTLYGREGDDYISGGQGDDHLFGGAGNDVLIGDGGNDHIYGGAGADFISGGFGNDQLFGGIGRDTIIGGPGDDTIFGGSGADTFVFRRGSGLDVIADFSLSEGDRIDLTSYLKNDINVSFDWVLGRAKQVDADVSINMGGKDSLVLQNYFVSDIQSDMFIF